MMDNKITEKIKILVVDDSSFVRRALIRMFENHPDIRIIDVASDGKMAVDLVKKLKPDVVTLDVKMPVLDGLSALQRIMKECPTPVIMLSSLTEKGGENTLKALDLGAVDFVDKTAAGGVMDFSVLARELTAKILIAARVDVDKLHEKSFDSLKTLPSPISGGKATELVLIGTSTGGPQALQHVLAKIPGNFPCPILVVQHMPVGFTASLAERLNRTCSITVKEAVDGEPVLPGIAYIAPAGKHLKITKLGIVLHVKLDRLPENTLHRPAVDVLFETAANVCGENCIAFILTGMGKDGSLGAMAIKKAGGKIFVESEGTSIVFGMPKAVMDSVQVNGVVPLYDVASAIIKNV
jgi:two-component system chemotaxis response regulator CheB